MSVISLGDVSIHLNIECRTDDDLVFYVFSKNFKSYGDDQMNE